jgi:hypothetical protein
MSRPLSTFYATTRGCQFSDEITLNISRYNIYGHITLLHYHTSRQYGGDVYI